MATLTLSVGWSGFCEVQMADPDRMLLPVTVALETIEIDHQMRFAGIDLDGGLTVSICVDCGTQGPIERRKFLARGLVLRLSIEPISLAS